MHSYDILLEIGECTPFLPKSYKTNQQLINLYVHISTRDYFRLWLIDDLDITRCLCHCYLEDLCKINIDITVKQSISGNSGSYPCTTGGYEGDIKL